MTDDQLETLRIRDSSFLLNESNVPMDIDDESNGHSSSSNTIENEDVFHLGNPVLNKSFDVLPQIKDDTTENVDALKLDDQDLFQPLLANQFSVEYPYVIPEPVETVTTLNVNKTLEGQEPSPSTSTTDRTFDTNAFVMKKKERRKVTTPATENSFNTASDDIPPDLCNKQSTFNTPSMSLDARVTSRPTNATISSQQSFMDPTRIM